MMLLTGLRSNNLQGYLAALGVARLLPGARLGWNFEEGCAWLEGVDDPVAALAEILRHKEPYKRLMWLTAKPEESIEKNALTKELEAAQSRLGGLEGGSEEKAALNEEIKALNLRIKTLKDRPNAEAFAGRLAKKPGDWGQAPDDGLWLRELWTPEGNANSLNLTGGGNSKTGFFGSLLESRNSVRRQAHDKLREALFGPWRHEDDVGSMCWEFESMGYAPRHLGENSPEHSKKRSVAAAQWLAGEGLPMLGCVEGAWLRLPLWARPEPGPVIIERMKHRLGERWLVAEKNWLPVSKGKPYWTARTSSDGKILEGSRKKNQPKYRDLYNGSELWMV